MYLWLVVRKVEAVLRIGRGILGALVLDPRLAEAAATMAAAQSGLEAKAGSLATAAQAEQEHKVRLGHAHDNAADALRELGFAVLALTGNNHQVDPYVRLLPAGYGEARQLPPREMADFLRIVLTKVAEEQEPKILAHREPLTAVLEALVAEEDACSAAVLARVEAQQKLKAEKRNWVRGLAHARSVADFACFSQPAYVRAIFAPASRIRRGAAPEEAGGDAGAGLESAPAVGPESVPVTGAESAPVPDPVAPGLVGAPTAG